MLTFFKNPIELVVSYINGYDKILLGCFLSEGYINLIKTNTLFATVKRVFVFIALPLPYGGLQ